MYDTLPFDVSVEMCRHVALHPSSAHPALRSLELAAVEKAQDDLDEKRHRAGRSLILAYRHRATPIWRAWVAVLEQKRWRQLKPLTWSARMPKGLCSDAGPLRVALRK